EEELGIAGRRVVELQLLACEGLWHPPQSYRPAAMHGIEIEPLEDEHLAAVAALLADRHARHRTAEALLPEVSDFRAQLERDLDHELASGGVALRGDEPVAYVIGRVEEDPM